MTSARIPEEDACHRARNLCVFSHVQKGTPILTHKGCVFQRVFLDATSDVTVVLRMRQSIEKIYIPDLCIVPDFCLDDHAALIFYYTIRNKRTTIA